MKQEICKCKHPKRRHEWTDGCCMNCNCQKYTQVEKPQKEEQKVHPSTEITSSVAHIVVESPQEEISKEDSESSKSSNSSVAQQPNESISDECEQQKPLLAEIPIVCSCGCRTVLKMYKS